MIKSLLLHCSCNLATSTSVRLSNLWIGVKTLACSSPIVDDARTCRRRKKSDCLRLGVARRSLRFVWTTREGKRLSLLLSWSPWVSAAFSTCWRGRNCSQRSWISLNLWIGVTRLAYSDNFVNFHLWEILGDKLDKFDECLVFWIQFGKRDKERKSRERERCLKTFYFISFVIDWLQW
jgi:hypothetical protein